MTGGTLIVTRAVNLHSYYKTQLEEFGFENFMITDTDRNGLDMMICETSPSHLMIEACFYRRSTPYMMIELLDSFPDLNITVFNLYDYPDDNAKWFILNGCNSYINKFEGIEEFYKGLKFVRDGKYYISPNIENCIKNMKIMPEKVDKISRRENEVLQLVCEGDNANEIAHNLNISFNTVKVHKQNLYRIFYVRNSNQLLWAAVLAGKVNFEETQYFMKNKLNINRRKNK
ncbi:MAG: LuxR C-terminal-related transcriptional regulator [Treponema sp.]|nr:LuxR C-terminal-related transcriptional regulator [Treponema sp.]